MIYFWSRHIYSYYIFDYRYTVKHREVKNSVVLERLACFSSGLTVLQSKRPDWPITGLGLQSRGSQNGSEGRQWIPVHGSPTRYRLKIQLGGWPDSRCCFHLGSQIQYKILQRETNMSISAVMSYNSMWGSKF